MAYIVMAVFPPFLALLYSYGLCSYGPSSLPSSHCSTRAPTPSAHAFSSHCTLTRLLAGLWLGFGQALARLWPGFGQAPGQALARLLGRALARLWPGFWLGFGQAPGQTPDQASGQAWTIVFEPLCLKIGEVVTAARSSSLRRPRQRRQLRRSTLSARCGRTQSPPI